MAKFTKSLIYPWFNNKIPKGSPLWLAYRYSWKILTKYKYKHPIAIYLYKIHDNIALHDHKALYFPIPKVACSSLKKYCADILNINIQGTDLKEDIHYKHFPYVKKYKINNQYKDYFKFCFVRNPWDRLVSLYNNKINLGEQKNQQHEEFIFQFIEDYKKFTRNMNFEDFVAAVCSTPDEKADSHFISQYIYITDNKGNILVDFIGEFDNFSNDFNYVREKIGEQTIVIPHLMKSKHDNYKHYYTTKTKDMVRQRYAKDIEILKYDF